MQESEIQATRAEDNTLSKFDAVIKADNRLNCFISVNPGVATPRFWADASRRGIVGGRERVSKNTIAYFAQKVLRRRLFIRKREKL